jgi:hypothetical protein
MMDTYEQMTDTELQTEIATRLGWTEIVFSRPFLVGREPGNIRPDENRYIISNWPQDANDALELLSDMDVITIDQRNIDVWIYRFPGDEIHVDASTIDYPLTPQTIARLWSIAWLRWKDSE